MPRTEYEKAQAVIANLWQTILFKEERLARYQKNPVNGTVHVILALEAQISAFRETIKLISSEFGLPPTQPATKDKKP